MAATKKSIPKVNSSRLRSVCPLLVPLDSTGRSYDGLLSAGGKDFRLKIQLPSNGRLSEAQLEGDLLLSKYLLAKKDTLQQRLRESKELSSFLMELIAILEIEMQNDISELPVLKPPKFYSKLIEDLNVLGWDSLTFVDESLSEVHVDIPDAKRRNHSLRIKFPPEYPDGSPTFSADLPCQLEIHFNKAKGLADMRLQFEMYLDAYQAFWDVLDEVDREMWVLEPEQPYRKDVTRRIALGKGSSLTFTVNPLFPNLKPECQFLGSEKVIGPLQEKLNAASLDLWDERKSIAENLRSLYGLEIPTRSNTKKEDIQGECGICYAYQLGDKIPDRICEDLRCQQQFHACCLFEWLRVLPTSQRSFNTIYGECPYCSKTISCKAPE